MAGFADATFAAGLQAGPARRAEPDLAIRSALQTAKVEVQIRSYSFPAPEHDTRFRTDRWFLDLSLTPRPGEPRGRYVDLWRGRAAERIGDIFVVPPLLEFSSSHGAGRHSALTLLFAPDLLELSPAALDEPVLAEGLHIRDPAIRRRLWRLATEVRRMRVESCALMEAEVLALAGDVERRLKAARSTDRAKRGGLPPARMRILNDRLRSNLPPPTISELAALCDLSERHMARAYLQETGESLGVWIANVTLQRAWTLLTRSQAPIGEIASRLGFSSSASFAAAFRNSTSCQPGEVRRSFGEPPPTGDDHAQARGAASNIA